jgi:hypothetical protein
MRKWRPATLFLICAGLTLVVGTIALVRYATRDHNIIVASPSTPGVFEDGRVLLNPGDQLCVSGVNFIPQANRVRLVAETKANPVPPLRVTARAGGQTITTIVDDYVSGRVTEILAPAHFNKPVNGSVCARNIGKAKVGMASSTEPRYYTAAVTTVNGHKTDGRASLQLMAPGQNSILGRMSTAVRQDATLTGTLSRPLVWLLLFVVLIGLVAGPLFAMYEAAKQDE